MKKFLTLFLVSLIFLCSMTVAGCGNTSASNTSSAQINYTEQTFSCIDKLTSLDYGGFYKCFDKALQKEITQADVQKIWSDFTVQYGTFEYYQTDITLTAKDGYQIADVPCHFKRGSVTVRLTFNKQGEICGFFITDNTSSTNSMQLAQDTEVTFGSEKYPISGSLTLPAGNGPFPAVILVHGSGPSDRNEQLGPNLPFMDLASQLSEQGIAVLRYDKRTYLYGAQMAELDNLTVQEETIDDVALAVEFLKTRNTIQSSQIYIAGHSLGGYLLPRIAQEAPDAAGYIFLAAPARPMEDLIFEQTEYILSLDKSLDDASKNKLLEQTLQMRNNIKSLTADSTLTAAELGNVPASYWLDLQKYDPLHEVQTLEKPMLFLQGGRDYQVSTTDYELWRAAMLNCPDADVHFQLFDNLNHLFMPGTGKSTPAEYQQKNIFSEDVSKAIAGFIKQHG